MIGKLQEIDNEIGFNCIYIINVYVFGGFYKYYLYYLKKLYYKIFIKKIYQNMSWIYVLF